MARSHDPLIVAFDLDDWEEVRRLAKALRGCVETVKVGLQLYTSLGPQAIDELKSYGFRIFADLKLHDIPNTVQGAVKGLVKRGVEMISVHASGGREMLKAAVRAADEEAEASGHPRPAVLGVTVLTSLSEQAALEVGWNGRLDERVLSLAGLCVSCGLDGVVSSALELKLLRKELGEAPLIVTPGIRMPGAPVHDQARSVEPAAALAWGADYLVVGRAVTREPDPRSAMQMVRRVAGLG
jgi:orotidine-5'-phosphate decarboxylase